MNKNLTRKSYFNNKILFRLTTKLSNLKKKPFRVARYKNSKHSLFILMLPNNTFTTLSSKFTKLHNITAGISGFKGPKRSSPYSRHVVARNMSYYIFKNKLIEEPLDLYFNSMITKKFFFFFKGLVSKPLNVNYIIRNKMVAHGFIRPKKKRRK